MKEYILCAAIWWDDDEIYPHPPRNIVTGIVICGRRHHNIIAIKARVGCAAFQKTHGFQGFLTSDDRFVDRREAAKIALAANQITELKYSKLDLYSEDLY